MSDAEAVAVVGAGRMGTGIAQAFLTSGSRVVLMDADAEAGARALERVIEGTRNAIERGFFSGDLDEVRTRLRVANEIVDLDADTALVIEAVPEIPELKKSLLADISATVGTGTVIATNTSSISVTDLAGAVTAPERFLGAHFFNPVPASKLVEIVRGAATGESVVIRTAEWIAGLGKRAVVVNDSPGFASSRLGVLLGLEAIRMVQEGVADAESIDDAMTLGYGHRMGPLRSTDLVGLDVRLAIAEYLESQLGERFAPPALLREKVERGELGRKSGRGFFDW
jgi:3-hydroxybutyryl-CoA dehydrogenase